WPDLAVYLEATGTLEALDAGIGHVSEFAVRWNAERRLQQLDIGAAVAFLEVSPRRRWRWPFRLRPHQRDDLADRIGCLIDGVRLVAAVADVAAALRALVQGDVAAAFALHHHDATGPRRRQFIAPCKIVPRPRPQDRKS